MMKPPLSPYNVLLTPYAVGSRDQFCELEFSVRRTDLLRTSRARTPCSVIFPPCRNYFLIFESNFNVAKQCQLPF
jgi:hypothetical protein